MTVEPAMRREEALAAIDVGRRIVEELIASGIDTIAVGEMGIGNTTAASALVAALTDRPPAEVTGRGTGLDAEAVASQGRRDRGSAATASSSPR